MKEITDYGKVFETLIEKTEEYILGNNLHAMVLGISGGIDSTVVAAICHEVSKRTNIPLIGRSLPSKYNKEGETTTADLVGKAFCNDYKVHNINHTYYTYLSEIILSETGDVYYDVDYDGNITYVKDDFLSPIAKGNIQARLRMIYLYNLASMRGGLVMDTDNLTENNLGYFTIHGDVGDFNPIGGLWKTEVFKLAEWLLSYYSFQLPHNMYEVTSEQLEKSGKIFQQGRAIKESLKLKPTAGLGITDSDLDEIGADNWLQVDTILQEALKWDYAKTHMCIEYKNINEEIEDFLTLSHLSDIPSNIIKNVVSRYFKSEFKRKQLPIKIARDEIV